jgi:hypothetical protein
MPEKVGVSCSPSQLTRKVNASVRASSYAAAEEAIIAQPLWVVAGLAVLALACCLLDRWRRSPVAAEMSLAIRR